MAFNEDGRTRHATRNLDVSRKQVSKVSASELKAVSTFHSTDRTRLHLDGLVQVVEFTCHAVSAAVVEQLVSSSGSQHSVVKEWVTEHAGLLSLSVGLVFCGLAEYETSHLDEHQAGSVTPIGLCQYLALANSCCPK